MTSRQQSELRAGAGAPRRRSGDDDSCSAPGQPAVRALVRRNAGAESGDGSCAASSIVRLGLYARRERGGMSACSRASQAAGGRHQVRHWWLPESTPSGSTADQLPIVAAGEHRSTARDGSLTGYAYYTCRSSRGAHCAIVSPRRVLPIGEGVNLAMCSCSRTRMRRVSSS